jgi:hypothetical protein
MAKRRSSKLAMALDRKLLVKFTRPFEDGWVQGYVLDIGPCFFLVALVSDDIWFNGFQCFRLSDVRELEVPYKYAAFAEAALRKRGERLPKKPRVRMTSLEELLLSAGRAFGVVSIHREHVDPHWIDIGRVVCVAKGRAEFLRIKPDANWDDEPNSYRLSEITRIDFGGDYENALQLIGGRPQQNNQAP